MPISLRGMFDLFIRPTDNTIDLTFGRWLRRLGIRYLTVLGLGSAGSLYFSGKTIVEYAWGFMLTRQPDWLLVWIALLQAATLGFIACLRQRGRFAFALGRPVIDLEQQAAQDAQASPAEWEEAKRAANDAVKLFRRHWNCLLYAWFLLYVAVAAQRLFKMYLPPLEPYAEAFTVLFGYAANLALVVCYLLLLEPAELRATHYTRWIVLFTVFCLIEMGAVLVSQMPVGESMGGDIRRARSSVEYVGGVIAAVSLALFAGRLDTKLLSLPVWTYTILYVYAALQVVYPGLQVLERTVGERPAITTGFASLICAFLMLKVFLILLVTWLLESGRLLWYLVRIRGLAGRVESEWTRFARYLREAHA
jgi:hypothetical protein